MISKHCLFVRFTMVSYIRSWFYQEEHKPQVTINYIGNDKYQSTITEIFKECLEVSKLNEKIKEITIESGNFSMIMATPMVDTPDDEHSFDNDKITINIPSIIPKSSGFYIRSMFDTGFYRYYRNIMMTKNELKFPILHELAHYHYGDHHLKFWFPSFISTYSPIYMMYRTFRPNRIQFILPMIVYNHIFGYYSRYTEYRADKMASEWLGVEDSISSMNKLQDLYQHDDDILSKCVNILFFSLFSKTHPEWEERIKNIKSE